jgi:hypothetical protein
LSHFGMYGFGWQIIEQGSILKDFTLHAARTASDLFMMGFAVLGLGEKAASFYIAISQHNDVIILFGEQK